MTEQTTEPTTETVPIPGAGTVGIRLPSGEVCNPIFVSAKSLVRMGDGEYDAIIGWVEGERKRAAAQRAEREAALAETAAQIRADAEARAAATAALKEREPWKF
jgi:hypothetical protein